MSRLSGLLPRALTLAFAACCGLSTAGLAAPTAADSSVPVGQLLSSEASGLYGESLQLPPSMTGALSLVELGDDLILHGFPMAPGERLDVLLKRHAVRAPGSQIYVIDRQGQRRLTLPERFFFHGHSLDEPNLRFALSWDPRSSSLRGTVAGPDGRHYEILPDVERAGRHLMRHVEQPLQEAAVDLTAHCDADTLPGHIPNGVRPANRVAPRGPSSFGEPTLTATIAVDTDNEFNHLKFANDTSAAASYIEDLFNEMNILYERDLGLQLLVGDTFLRLDLDEPPTYDDDPYDNTDSPASAAALNEFGGFWSGNVSGVDRVFAMLLSGKSSSSNSASGIAWVDGYCETQSSGGGYSVNQIFRGNFPIINDARLVGHELGHNAGSPHTHCYSPPIDECSNIGSGCHSGPLSCPPEGTGTVMSYCHFSSGSNCGTNRFVFDPAVITNLDGFILAHTPTCVEPITAPGEIFDDGFESGGTTQWSDAQEGAQTLPRHFR